MPDIQKWIDDIRRNGDIEEADIIIRKLYRADTAFHIRHRNDGDYEIGMQASDNSRIYWFRTVNHHTEGVNTYEQRHSVRKDYRS